jgi:hypothetical protein
MRTTIIITLTTIAMLFTCCSPVKNTYEEDINRHFQNYKPNGKVLSAADINHLPPPVQRYFEYCGFIGRPLPLNAEVVWEESHIRMSPDKEWMKLSTRQYNCVENPFRIAYMKARMFGIIPFDGRDIYVNGTGHMYGKIGNLFTVFDEKTHEIAQSALIIIMAEALLIPGYALADYTSWEAIDDQSARIRMVLEGIDVSGTFYFDEAGRMIRFETNDRYFLHPKEGNVLTGFSAEVGDYKKQGDLMIPGSLMAIWHLETGRYEYWKGRITGVKYNISL